MRPPASRASASLISLAASSSSSGSLNVGGGSNASALADLAGIGCDIVTIGHYLRPTSNPLPIARWVEPHEFDRWKGVGEQLGIGHVEASPLTRSSYHAKQAADQVAAVHVRV